MCHPCIEPLTQSGHLVNMLCVQCHVAITHLPCGKPGIRVILWTDEDTIKRHRERVFTHGYLCQSQSGEGSEYHTRG